MERCFSPQEEKDSPSPPPAKWKRGKKSVFYFLSQFLPVSFLISCVFLETGK